jgi:glucan phosphoethanolaminetransferase (alkaline phosphatase superfamily)
MNTYERSGTGKPRALETIGFGGLAIGVLDFLDASIFFPLYFGIGFIDVWHGPASGLIGREASRAGGWPTAILGIFLHFCVAFAIAAVFYLLIRSFPQLLKHPIFSGLIFGIAAHFVMQYVVVPMSAISTFPAWPPLGSLLNSLIGHALLVGLPAALIASWSARRHRLS